MAAPLTPDQLVNALKAEGLDVRTYGEWRTRNRNHKGPWGPIHGTMFHHTGGGPDGAVQYCYSGSPELPGPLCQGVIDKEGVVWVISAGRANHAGGGDPNVLAAVRDERYNDYPPVTHQHQGTAGAVDGNAYFYGFECVNEGDNDDIWPPVQVDAMVRAGAAISRVYGWSEKSVIAHKEWSDYKPDPEGPGFPSMKAFRAKIAERLQHAPSWSPDAQQGPDMTVPNLSVLLRGEDTTLPNGVTLPIYWTEEWSDEGNEHGDNGRTVLDGGKYTATLNFYVVGLAVGKTLSVRAMEYDPVANTYTHGKPHQITGTATPAVPVQVNVTFTGKVVNRLSFEVMADSDGVATGDMQLAMLSWPNA